MKKHCEYLREQAMKIINFEKKKMISLTNEQQESREKTKIAKLVTIVVIQVNAEVLHMAYLIENIMYPA